MSKKIKTCGKFNVPIKGKKSLKTLMDSLGGTVIENKKGNHRFKAVYQGKTCPLGKTTDYKRHFIPWLKEAIQFDYKQDYVKQMISETIGLRYDIYDKK